VRVCVLVCMVYVVCVYVSVYGVCVWGVCDVSVGRNSIPNASLVSIFCDYFVLLKNP